jgi:hypothetical protein
MRTETRNRKADRRHGHRALYVRGGLFLFVWFAGWSVTGSAPAAPLGSPTCIPRSAATTRDYLTGVVCPPAGFRELLGYDPILVHTAPGWRYTKPAWADGRCSGPLHNVGRTLELETACRTHDYGYDLVRFGVGIRAEADELLYRDMMTICSARGSLTASGCRAVARWTRTVLEVGDATGFDPEPLVQA